MEFTTNDIIFLARNEIDDEKWNHAVLNSRNGRIYATTNWLDAFVPDWKALVLLNYKIIMPLPSFKKYGIRYLAQPPFTQQLGLFASTEIDKQAELYFIQKAISIFKFAEMNMNINAAICETQLKKNYILPLTQPYELISSKYSKSLRNNNLKPSKSKSFFYNCDLKIDLAIDMFKKLYQKKMNIADSSYHHLKALANKLAKNHQCFTRSVWLNEKLLAINLYFKDEKRIYNIATASIPEYRKLNATDFLIDSLIQEFSNSGFIFDFEGSNIPGIEAFYKKFGAVLEPYYFIKWNNLSFPYHLFKK